MAAPSTVHHSSRERTQSWPLALLTVVLNSNHNSVRSVGFLKMQWFRSLSRPTHTAPKLDVRLLVAITFHYVEARFEYLANVITEIASFPIKQCDIQIFTNVPSTQRLRDLLEALAINYKVVHVEGLDHPFDLAWSHKRAITGDFLEAGSRCTHFIYLEDDERLSYASLLYFLRYREALRPSRLFPSFVRTEWSRTKLCVVNTDNFGPSDLSTRPYAQIGDLRFVSLDNPYCGLYILDRQLADEHVRSRSFDPKSSQDVMNMFHVRERAAMGMLFEDRPIGFSSRGVVPLSTASKRILASALVPHLPNTYSDDPNSPLAKLPLDEIVCGNFS